MTASRPILPWVVWGTAVALYMVAVINRSSLSALGPAAQEHFGIDASTLAAFPVIQLIVYAGCQIPVGMLLDRFGSSALILVGAVLMMIGQLVMATVSEVSLAILARVLVGAGDACTFISVMRLLPDWFHPRQLPTISQMTGLIGQIGQLMSVTPLALVVAALGWAGGFFGVIALGLLFTLLGVAVLRDAPGKRTVIERVTGRTWSITERSVSESQSPVTAVMMAPPSTSMIPIIPTKRGGAQVAGGSQSFFARMRRLVSIPGVRLAFWIHFVSPFAAHVFLLLWGTPFLTGGLGMSVPQAGGLLSLTVVSSMVAGVVLGPISSRYVERRVWLVIGTVSVIAVTWLTVILWQGVPPMWIVIALLVILPLGGPVSMISFEVARSHTPRSFAGLSTGFVNTGGFISALIVVMGIGVVLDLMGAGSPETYSLHAFQLGFAVQVPFWVLGLVMIFIERRKTGRWMEEHGRTLR